MRTLTDAFLEHDCRPHHRSRPIDVHRRVCTQQPHLTTLARMVSERASLLPTTALHPRRPILNPTRPDVGWACVLGRDSWLGHCGEVCGLSAGNGGTYTVLTLFWISSQSQLPLTDPYPGPRSVLVLDNCKIHHAEEVRAVVEDEARKCFVLCISLSSRALQSASLYSCPRTLQTSTPSSLHSRQSRIFCGATTTISQARSLTAPASTSRLRWPGRSSRHLATLPTTLS